MRRLACLFLLAAPLARAQDVTIRVATFYTPESEAAALADGTTIEARIADAFRSWQAVLDSATTGSPRVVAHAVAHVRLPTFVETQACGTDLQAFFDNSRARAVRDSARASLAVLFPEHCSAAFQCTEGSAGCEAQAYALAQARDAGPVRQTLAHEAGHLFGMRHNPESDPTPGDAHALVNPEAGLFTVLGQRGGLPREALVPYYSDPRRTLDGVPLGIAGLSDNAAVLRRTAATVATWNANGTPVDPGPAAAPALRVAPNPASQVWRVALPADPAERVGVVVDALGRRVATVRVPAGATAVDVPAAGLAPGVYGLRISAGRGRPVSARLVRGR